MASSLTTQPLDRFQKIVNDDGTPTEYFMRLLQTRQNLLTDFEGAVDAAVEGIEAGKADKVTQIIAGDELSGGGDLSADRTIDHEEKNAGNAGTYGSSTKVARVTCNEFGHITDIDEVPISGGGGGGGGGLYDISMGVPLLSDVTPVGSAYYTFTENAGKGINIKNTSNVGANSTIGGIQIAIPSPTFHVCFLVLSQNARYNFYFPLIAGFNSANGRYQSYGISQATGATGFDIGFWTAYNSRSSVLSDGNGPLMPGPMWMHYMYDGTNIKMGYSMDGANPIFTYVNTLADWLGGITDVLIGQFTYDSATFLGTSTSVLCYDPDANSRVVGV